MKQVVWFLILGLATLLPAIAAAADPMRVSTRMEEGIPQQANMKGKYSTLLRVLLVPNDKANYGEMKDFGFWAGQQYLNFNNLPAGHWVYVYPKWYIWKDAK